MSELQLIADRSLASVWEWYNLTSSIVKLLMCTGYNDPYVFYSCRRYWFAANVAKKKKKVEGGGQEEA